MKRPIDTAPRDGTVVYLYSADESAWCLAYYDERRATWAEYPCGEVGVTWASHWSSLGDGYQTHVKWILSTAAAIGLIAWWLA